LQSDHQVFLFKKFITSSLYYNAVITGILETGLEQNQAKDDFKDYLACLEYHSTLGGFLQPVGKFYLHNLEFQQIHAASLASFFYSRTIQLPSNYISKLSFLSHS